MAITYPPFPIKDALRDYQKGWFYSELPGGSCLKYIGSPPLTWYAQDEKMKRLS